jgi:LacI family transcriptional regulator
MPRTHHSRIQTTAGPLRIAILVDTSTGYSTHLIRGIARFVREEQPGWQLLVQPRGENERSLMPRHWQTDGVIARITHRALARDLQRRRVPVVNVSISTVAGFDFPQVTVDERLVGQWAAQHLLEQGFRSFGYFGNWGQANYADRCGPVFAECVLARGFQCRFFRPLRAGATNHQPPTAVAVQRWLRDLPKPVGILATDANDAHLIREHCRGGTLRIPEDVAIVSGEDDELLCAISQPALTCIDLGSERVGYEAGELLNKLLANRRSPSSPTLLPPLRIIARQSTDTLAIEDPALAKAVRYIRANAHRPIQVVDVLRQVLLSRRALEQRFRTILGCSPAAEIRRVHLERAKELLITTDAPTSQIAQESGFNYTEVMNQVFRRELRQTPTEYRRSAGMK